MDVADEVDEITDEELTRLALAADPDAEVPDDAVSVWELLGDGVEPLLPVWYMPPPAGGVAHGRRWKRAVVLVIIAAFLALNAAGLCSTYGWITIA